MLIFAWGGCGYRLQGGGNLPLPNNRLCIQIFDNQTMETGLENTVATAMRYEFSRHGNIILTCGENIGGYMGGTLKSTRIETISRTGVADSMERRITLTMALGLTGADGELVWASGEMSANEAYAVTPNKIITEQNRGAALSALSKRLAETVYHRLISDF